MKVVFMEEVEGTASIGEVKNVADGFARNYLLPRRLAAPATEHYITIAQARAGKEAKRQERFDEEARIHLVPKVEGRSVTIEVRVGEQGKLFGSVTARDIAEALQAATGIELEHKQVDLRHPIRDIGVQEVTVKLTRNVLVPINVSVEPLGGLPEEEAPAEGEEAPAGAEPAEAGEAVAEQPEAEEAAEEEPETEEAAKEPEAATEEAADAESEAEPEAEAEEQAEEAAEDEEPAAEEPAAEEPAEAEPEIEAATDEPAEAEEPPEAEEPAEAEEQAEEAAADEEPAAEEQAEEADEPVAEEQAEEAAEDESK